MSLIQEATLIRLLWSWCLTVRCREVYLVLGKQSGKLKYQPQLGLLSRPCGCLGWLAAHSITILFVGKHMNNEETFPEFHYNLEIYARPACRKRTSHLTPPRLHFLSHLSFALQPSDFIFIKDKSTARKTGLPTPGREGKLWDRLVHHLHPKPPTYPYAIKNQRGGFRCDELVLYGIKELA